jgi:hypothetical protein
MASDGTVTPSPSRPAKPESEGQWTCWYEGAPILRLPVPAKAAVLRSARAGQVLAAETVESSPLGTEWLRVRRGSDTRRQWIALAYCRRVAPENLTAGNLPIGRERIDRYSGLPLNYRPNDMVALPQRYCYNDEPQLLRDEAARACREMLDAARREARLRIRVVSAYRSARTQAYLCRRKINAAGFGQRLVERPGHSEHQLGTTVDLVGAEGRHLLEEGFASSAEGQWLELNCRRFGFVPSYTRERAERDGITFEPWHLRYVGRENLRQFTRGTPSH